MVVGDDGEDCQHEQSAAPKATANLPPQPEVRNRDVCSLGELAMYPDGDVCPLSTTRSGKMLKGEAPNVLTVCCGALAVECSDMKRTYQAHP
jgi:hypothetical protein